MTRKEIKEFDNTRCKRYDFLEKENEELKHCIREMYECKYEPDKLLCLRDYYLKPNKRNKISKQKTMSESEILTILKSVVKGKPLLFDKRLYFPIVKALANKIPVNSFCEQCQKDWQS